MLLNTRKKYYFYQSATHYYVSEILLVQLCTTTRDVLYKVLFELSSISRLLAKISPNGDLRAQSHLCVCTQDGTLWIPADVLLDTFDGVQANIIKEIITDIYESDGRELTIIEKETLFENVIITHDSDTSAYACINLT